MPLLRDLLDVLLPTPCAACGALAGDGRLLRLCAACEAQLPQRAWPLASAIPNLSSAWCFAPYQGLAGQLVRTGKFGLRAELLAELSELAARRCRAALPAVDLVIGVPTPWQRRVARGFSVPEILGEALSRELDRPRASPLARGRTPRQARLARAERWGNASAGFRLAGALDGEPRVLLVDDVVTTGATAATCAALLREGGARDVHLFAFASALP